MSVHGRVSDLRAKHDAGVPFAVEVLALSEEDLAGWVQFVTNPNRFLPSIFSGNWAAPQRHPEPGSIRVVRVISGSDGVTRVIGRQGNELFATPWIQ